MATDAQKSINLTINNRTLKLPYELANKLSGINLTINNRTLKQAGKRIDGAVSINLTINNRTLKPNSYAPSCCTVLI